MFNGLCWFNDLVMRKSSCISQIGHKSNDSCPYKREAKGGRDTGRGHVQTEVETGVIQPQVKDSGSQQKLEKQRRILLRAFVGNRPCPHLDFSPPELWENKLPGKATKFVIICHNCQREVVFTTNLDFNTDLLASGAVVASPVSMPWATLRTAPGPQGRVSLTVESLEISISIPYFGF